MECLSLSHHGETLAASGVSSLAMWALTTFLRHRLSRIENVILYYGESRTLSSCLCCETALCLRLIDIMHEWAFVKREPFSALFLVAN